MARNAVMLCGHGSRDGEAIAEFERLTQGLAAMLPDSDVERGSLEFAAPTISDGLETLRRRGHRRIAAVPVLLSAAGHIKRDIPRLLKAFATENPSVELRFGRELDFDPRLLDAAEERIEAAEAQAGAIRARDETVLLVIGRGVQDETINDRIASMAILLQQRMGFAAGFTAYSGVASPLAEPELRRIAKSGFLRIVVFPYFLFTGVLVKRISAAVERAATEIPQVEFVVARHFGDHALVLDCLADRVRETVAP